MSQNKFNNKEMHSRCLPMSKLQAILSGKWKLLILWYISYYEVLRFGEIQKQLDNIAHSTLTRQLRELEDDGLINRKVYNLIPPKVEYSLSELGESFRPILNKLMKWSHENLCKNYDLPHINLDNDGGKSVID